MTERSERSHRFSRFSMLLGLGNESKLDQRPARGIVCADGNENTYKGSWPKIAGWGSHEESAGLSQQGNVLSSNWTPPLLKGVVQEGAADRAGLVIKDTI